MDAAGALTVVLSLQGLTLAWLIVIERRLSRIEGMLYARRWKDSPNHNGC